MDNNGRILERDSHPQQGSDPCPRLLRRPPEVGHRVLQLLRRRPSVAGVPIVAQRLRLPPYVHRLDDSNDVLGGRNGGGRWWTRRGPAPSAA